MRIYTKTYGMCLKLYSGKSVTLKNFTVKKGRMNIKESKYKKSRWVLIKIKTEIKQKIEKILHHSLSKDKFHIS